MSKIKKNKKLNEIVTKIKHEYESIEKIIKVKLQNYDNINKRRVTLLFILLLMFVAVVTIFKPHYENETCYSLVANNTNIPYCNESDVKLENGSFEEKKVYGSSESWQTTQQEPISIVNNETSDKFNCSSGENCLEIQLIPGEKIYQIIDVGDTKEGTLAFDYFTFDENSDVSYGIIEKDKDGNVLNEQTDTLKPSIGNWTSYQKKYSFMDETTSIELYFTTSNDNTFNSYNALVDNINMGGEAVYDNVMSVYFDGEYLNISTQIDLVQGQFADPKMTYFIDQDVNVQEVLINGEIDSKLNIETTYEEYEKDTVTSSGDPEIGRNTSITISDLPKEESIKINLKLQYNIFDTANSTTNIQSSLIFGELYKFHVDTYNGYQVQIKNTSKLEATQKLTDENGDGVATLGEKLSFELILDNSKSSFDELNVSVKYNNTNDKFLDKISIDGVQIYNKSGESIDKEEYTFDPNSKKIVIDRIPNREVYTLKYDLYVVSDMPLVSSDTIQNLTVVNSTNMNNTSIYITSAIEFSKEGANTLIVYPYIEEKDDTRDLYSLTVHIVGSQNNLINNDLQIIFTNNYSSIDYKVMDETLKINSSTRNLVKGQDYSINDGEVIINQVFPNEEIFISMDIKMKLEQDVYSMEPFFILYKTEEKQSNYGQSDIDGSNFIWKVIELNVFEE